MSRRQFLTATLVSAVGLAALEVAVPAARPIVVPHAPGYVFERWPDPRMACTVFRLRTRQGGQEYGLDHVVTDLEAERSCRTPKQIEADVKALMLWEMNANFVRNNQMKLFAL